MVAQQRLKCAALFAIYVAPALLLDVVAARLDRSVGLVDIALVLAAQLVVAFTPFAEGGEWRNTCAVFLAVASAAYLFAAAALFALVLLLGGVDVSFAAGRRHL